MIYLPAFRFFGEPNERFFNFMQYASSIDDELLYDSSLYENQPYANLIVAYVSKSDSSKIVKFAKPKRKLIFKNCFIRFDNMLFEFPENTDFINCTIYLFRSKIVKPPVNCIFNNCDIEITNRKPGSPKLPNKIIMATRALLKHNKSKL